MKTLYAIVGSVLLGTFSTAQHQGWTLYSAKPNTLASAANSGTRVGSTGYTGGRTGVGGIGGTGGTSFGHK